MDTDLDPALTSAREARQRTAAELRRCGCDELIDVAQLVVSELVTNVVVHVGSRPRLRVRTDRRVVRIEVRDAVTTAPQLRRSSLDAVDGRGLELIDALASRWGAEALPAGGKVVWAELDRDSA